MPTELGGSSSDAFAHTMLIVSDSYSGEGPPPSRSNVAAKVTKKNTFKNRSKLMIKFKQKSTKIGLSLIAASLAVATGNSDLINVELTDSGVNFSGLAELAFSLVTGVVGLVLGLVDTDKKKDKTDDIGS